jgi:hypothetical protein
MGLLWAALLRLLRVKRDLLGLKLLDQVVSGLVSQWIDHPPLDPSVVSNSLIDLDALLTHSQYRIRALAILNKTAKRRICSST